MLGFGANRKMPTAKKIKGNIAESVAILYLLLAGYTPLKRNAQNPIGEVDVLAKKGDALCLVEVKFRQTKTAAFQAIHPMQRERLLKQASFYQRRYKTKEVRVDAVLIYKEWPFFAHLKNAW